MRLTDKVHEGHSCSRTITIPSKESDCALKSSQGNVLPLRGQDSKSEYYVSTEGSNDILENIYFMRSD